METNIVKNVNVNSGIVINPSSSAFSVHFFRSILTSKKKPGFSKNARKPMEMNSFFNSILITWLIEKDSILYSMVRALEKREY